MLYFFIYTYTNKYKVEIYFFMDFVKKSFIAN